MDTPTITSRAVTGAATLLGASLIIGTIIVAATLYRVKALGNTISVTGSADRTVQSDTAKWTSNFTSQTDAYSLKAGTLEMKRQLGVVLDYLKMNGIADSQITVQPLSMTQLCETNNNISYDKFGNQSCGSGGIRGYNLQQGLIVESEDVQKIKQLSQDSVNALIAQGILFNNQSVEYYYNKLSDLRIELLADATQDAQKRAAKIAESTGQQIGSIQSASMGVIQVTAKNSIDFSDYGSYDTSVIEKKVTGVVRASFTVR